MNCPDTERLFSLALGEATDPELEAHMLSCEECKREILLVRELRQALEPQMHVPDVLIESTVDMVLDQTATEKLVHATAWDVPVAACLGALTTTLTVIATGSLGSGGLPALAAIGLLGAIGSGGWEYRLARLDPGRA